MKTSTVDNKVNWYVRLLLPLSRKMKLDIINRLTASMLTKKKKKKNEKVFDGLNNSWCDEVSAEEEIKSIRNARTSNTTRLIEDF